MFHTLRVLTQQFLEDYQTICKDTEGDVDLMEYLQDGNHHPRHLGRNDAVTSPNGSSQRTLPRRFSRQTLTVIEILSRNDVVAGGATIFTGSPKAFCFWIVGFLHRMYCRTTEAEAISRQASCNITRTSLCLQICPILCNICRAKRGPVTVLLHNVVDKWPQLLLLEQLSAHETFSATDDGAAAAVDKDITGLEMLWELLGSDAGRDVLPVMEFLNENVQIQVQAAPQGLVLFHQSCLPSTT
jgi:hypothetical protein